MRPILLIIEITALIGFLYSLKTNLEIATTFLIITAWADLLYEIRRSKK